MKPFNPTSPTLTSCDRIWLVHERSRDGVRRSASARSAATKGLFLLGLEGIESLNDLEPWQRPSEAESEAIPDAGAGEVYHFEVVGLEVRTVDGDSLGPSTK